MKLTPAAFFNRLFPDSNITFKTIMEDGSNRTEPHYGKYSQDYIDQHNGTSGVFFMVNNSGSIKTKDSDIHSFNAVFVDFDDCSLPEHFPLQPSAILSREDKNGHHVYWFLNSTDDEDSWKKAMQLLIRFYKSDPAVKNPSRLMRVPGTKNMKPKREGQQYDIIQLNNKRYDISDIFTSHQDMKQIIKSVASYAKHLMAKEQFNKDDKGSKHKLMIAVIMRMEGLGFSNTDKFKFLRGLCDKYFPGEYTDQTLENKSKAGKYANNKKGVELQEAIEVELARQDRVREALTDWCYVQDNSFFLNLKHTGIERSREAFNAQFAYIGDCQNVAGYVFTNDLIKQANAVQYEPGQERLIDGPIEGVKDINLWVDDRVQADDSCYQWFLDHIEYLVPLESEREHFLDWLAFSVQTPGAKVIHAVLIIGRQGIGKSILTDLYRNIYGPSNVAEPHNENLSDKYTSWARNTSLCVINELQQADKYQFYNHLKPFISDPRVEIREMYKDTYKINNHTNIIAYSNDEIPIKLAKDDRRWFVIKSDATRKHDDYYVDLAGKCNTHAGGVVRFLLERDITGFNPGQLPPATEAKKFIQLDSRPELDLWVDECITYQAKPFDKDLVSIKDVMEGLPEAFKYNNKITSKYVAKIVRSHRGMLIDKAVRIGGEVKFLMVIRNHEKYRKFLDDRDAKGAYEYMLEFGSNEKPKDDIEVEADNLFKVV